MLTLRCSDCSDDDGFDEAIETAVCANITGLTNPSNQSFTYGYDGLDRLTTSDQTGTASIEYTFSYDITGNLAKLTNGFRFIFFQIKFIR
jgi:YD repeat-containing protein